MKKIALSSALAALVALPALGIEVYNNEEKDASVEIYGSLRGFVGGGGAVDGTPKDTGNFLIGFQTNSNFGIDTKYGKFFSKIEFGLSEGGFLGSPAGKNGNYPGLRKVYGSYDFGSAGKLTFGKLDTPSVEGGFQTDFNHNDAGGNGFGSVTTGSRKLQVQYAHSGVTVAIIADEAKEGNSYSTAYTQNYSNTRLEYAPRIAFSYESKLGEKGKLKIAATYKYYANGTSAGGATHKDIHAGHILVGAKIGLGGESTLSTFFNYGINGDLYNEQQTAYSAGRYGYSTYNDAGLWAQRAGLLVEYGTKLNDTLSLAAGAGYQATFNGDGQRGTTLNNGLQSIHGYKFYVNAPISVAKGFTIVPQLAFYDTIKTGNHGFKTSHQSALLGLVRLKYDF